ncbi:MAG: capsular polysaccharide biosynthesis protein, partial [Halomonas sp.]|nr:capsular polysaccharide biosynthesis protein [Halomonas sp.]
LEETIHLIADQKRQQEHLRGEWLACGFSFWKRRFVGHFLGPASNIKHIKELPKLLPDNRAQPRILVWSSRIDAAFKTRHAEYLPHIWRMEDGFIRSVGLGVDLSQPLSLVIDASGIYYDPNQPSDLERLLNTYPMEASLLERAAQL